MIGSSPYTNSISPTGSVSPAGSFTVEDDSFYPITVIDSAHPLELGKFTVLDEDSVISLEFSGNLMASICIGGQVKIWQISPRPDRPNWPLLRILQDCEEKDIDEFLTGSFLPNGNFVVAGKRKVRHGWDDKLEDSKSLCGVLKIFNIKTGQCLQRLGQNHPNPNPNPNTNTNPNTNPNTNHNAHSDEILYLKPITTRNSGNFIISCGQDGRICRWSFSDDWNDFKNVSFCKLGEMAFHFDQISEELLGVAVDNCLIIYDIIKMRIIRKFKTGFTSYCDFVKVVNREGTKIRILLRGVELLKTDTQEPSAPNSILLTEINLSSQHPSTAKIISRFKHPLYNANSWLIKPGLTQNTSYLAAPTITGRVLIFNTKNRNLTACLHAHDDCEVRQVIFHEKLPIMATCGDDGRIRIYYGLSL